MKSNGYGFGLEYPAHLRPLRYTLTSLALVAGLLSMMAFPLLAQETPENARTISSTTRGLYA